MADPEPNAIFEQMQFDYDVAGSAVGAAVAKLEAAIKLAKSMAGNKSEEFVTAADDDLDVARELVPGAIEKVAVARGSAKIAAYDMPSVKAHKQEILDAIEQIAKWEKQLLKLDTTAEKLKESAIVSQEKLIDVSVDFEKWVQDMQPLATDLTADQAFLRKSLDELHAKALKCSETHNANGLALARMDADDLPLKSFEDRLAKLAALVKKATDASSRVSAETRKATMTDFGRPRHRCEALTTDLQYFHERKKAIKAMKAVSANVDLALKTLGLPPAQKAALAKALVGDDAQMTKALDVLGKALKPPKPGKDLFAALRKAKVV